MDPDANLTEQLRIIDTLLNGESSSKDWYEVGRLCELVVSLNAWIEDGGHLPRRWRKSQDEGTRQANS